MLEGEQDGYLGYDKHEQSPNSNSRNGYGKKEITSYGESEISVPRDREASFNRTGDPADDCSQAGEYGEWN
jgi:transposase-like protein